MFSCPHKGTEKGKSKGLFTNVQVDFQLTLTHQTVFTSTALSSQGIAKELQKQNKKIILDQLINTFKWNQFDSLPAEMCRDQFLHSCKFKHRVALVCNVGVQTLCISRLLRRAEIFLCLCRREECFKRLKSHCREQDECQRMRGSGSGFNQFHIQILRTFLSVVKLSDKIPERKQFTLLFNCKAIPHKHA